MCINSFVFEMDNLKKQLTNVWIILLLIAGPSRVDCIRLRVRDLTNNNDIVDQNLATGCYHNGSMYADRSMVPTMEPCLFCKCLSKTLVCALKVCQEQPMPPPRGCILVQKKNMCCPYLSCTKLHIPAFKTDDRRIIIFGKDEYKLDKSALNSVQQRTNHLRWADDEEDDDHVEEEVCIKDGTIYRSGSAMSSSTLCSYCYCLNGREKCVRPKCVMPLKGCQPIFVDATCCPIRYDCGGKMTTAKNITKSPNTLEHISNKHFLRMMKRGQRSNGCTIDKVYYPEGQKLPASEDPCEICFCIRGVKKCTMQKCTPPVNNCIPKIPKGQCCAASFECKPSDKHTGRALVLSDESKPFKTVQVVMPSQNTSDLMKQVYRKLGEPEEDAESFDLLSLLFGPDEPTTATTPILTTPTAEVMLSASPESVSTTTTESSFFDFLRAGLEMIDSNDDIEKVLQEKDKVVAPSTEGSIFDSLFGDDDEEEVTVAERPVEVQPEIELLDRVIELTTQASSTRVNLTIANVTTPKPVFQPGTILPVSLIRHHTKISDMNMTGNSGSNTTTTPVPFKRLPDIPNIFLDTSTMLTSRKPTTTTTRTTPTTSTTTTTTTKKPTTTSTTKKTTTTNSTTKKPTTSSTTKRIRTTKAKKKPKTTTTKKTTTTATTTTTTKTEPPTTESVVTTLKEIESTQETTTEAVISESTVTVQLSTGAADVTTEDQLSTLQTEGTTTDAGTTVRDKLEHKEMIEVVTVKHKTTESKVTTDPPVKNSTTENILSVIFGELKDILNGTTTNKNAEKKPELPDRIISRPLTPQPPISPMVIANINRNPSILEADYNYDYSEPTLPPSLPNLKIIPFLATDAVKNDRNKNTFSPSANVEEVKPELKLQGTGSVSVVNIQPLVETQYPVITEKPKATIYPDVFEKSVSSSISAVSPAGGAASGVNVRYNNRFINDKYEAYDEFGGAHYNPLEKVDYENNLKYTTDDSYLPIGYSSKYEANGYADGNNYYHNAYTEYDAEQKKPAAVIAKPVVSGFHPPTKTEGGFVPKEPIKDDFYYESYHKVANGTIDITTEFAVHEVEKIIAITTPNWSKDVPHTDEKERILPVKVLNYSAVNFQHDKDFDAEMISITTDTNYNVTPEYSAEVLPVLMNKTSTPMPTLKGNSTKGNSTKGMFSFENVFNYLFRDEEPIEDSELYRVTPDLNETATLPTVRTTTTGQPILNFTVVGNQSTEAASEEVTFGPVDLETIAAKNTTSQEQKPTSNKNLYMPTMQDLQFLTTKYHKKPTKLDTNSITSTAESYRVQPIRSDLSPLLNKIESYNNYQILPELAERLKNDPNYAINPVDVGKMKLHHSEGAMEVFTKPTNMIKDPAGILKLAGCNIYGRMYRVGRIISELSSPCLECKCTDVGVHCTPLKC